MSFLNALEARWGKPVAIVCDRFRKAELLDALTKGRMARSLPASEAWVSKTEPKTSALFRRAALDKRICAPVSWAIRSALTGARVVIDPAGNSKLAKNSEGGRKKTHRDDLVAALILGISEYSRKAFRPASSSQEAEVVSLDEGIPAAGRNRYRGGI